MLTKIVQNSTFQSTIATSTFDTSSTLPSPQAVSISASHRCSIDDCSSTWAPEFRSLDRKRSSSICMAQMVALFFFLFLIRVAGCSKWCRIAGFRPDFQTECSNSIARRQGWKCTVMDLFSSSAIAIAIAVAVAVAVAITIAISVVLSVLICTLPSN